MKTLFVTDLDGTLLSSTIRLSDYSRQAIGALIEKCVPITCATARAHASASTVLGGLKFKMPMIVHNGTMITGPEGNILRCESFGEQELSEISEFLCGRKIYPLVYSILDGRQRVSWLEGFENEGMRYYLDNRRNDMRLRGVKTVEELYAGENFYFTCIGERKELQCVYDTFGTDERVTCYLQQELYRPEYWCEIMPRRATKAQGILTLKEMLGFDRVVCFGDAVNDVPMFHIADEAYAPENAVPLLKEIATGIIASNDADGVARWLFENAHAYE